jgi:seryl-tRNA synthetase
VEERSNSKIPATYKVEELKNEIRKILKEFSAQTSKEKFQLEDIKEVESIIGRLLEKQERNKLLFDEFNEATEEINGVPDESLTVRLKEAHETFQKFSEALNEKDIDSDEGFIKNSELLKKFIDDKIWKKP